MASNQEGNQAGVRTATGTTLDYNGDWHALFDAAAIGNFGFNGRMLTWINQQLSSSYTNVQDAMNAYAINAGFTNWHSMNTIDTSPGGPANGFLQETGTFGFLLEDGLSDLLMEA